MWVFSWNLVSPCCFRLVLSHLGLHEGTNGESEQAALQAEKSQVGECVNKIDRRRGH